MNVFGLLPTHVWRRRVVIQKISFQPFHSQEVHGVRPLILMMLVLRIWYWINLQFPYCYFSYWYYEEKFCLGHTWEFSGLKIYFSSSKVSFIFLLVLFCRIVFRPLWQWLAKLSDHMHQIFPREKDLEWSQRNMPWLWRRSGDYTR